MISRKSKFWNTIQATVDLIAVSCVVTGRVQGVGFRPFVYGLANDLALSGEVRNSSNGAEVIIEGEGSSIVDLFKRMIDELPAPGVIKNIVAEQVSVSGYENFSITNSEHGGEVSLSSLADLPPCDECKAELFDVTSRRYLHPFISCAHCGPRFTIVNQLPYDRPLTSLTHFPLCHKCEAEYTDPTNRRFHAQTISCPDCGPQLKFAGGVFIDVIKRSLAVLINGQILAIKGVGGYQLLVDASNQSAVERLRRRKFRPEKPFALMYENVSAVRLHAQLAPAEEELLSSLAAPIVILKKFDVSVSTNDSIPANNVAGDNNPYLGIMLPSSPLHHLLLKMFGRPLVVTSGNVSGEPIIVDDIEALKKLALIADYFLVHDREIVRRADDSVVRVVAGRVQILRLGRGYAPLVLPVDSHKGITLATGSQQKNAIAVAVDASVTIMQYGGDLTSLRAELEFSSMVTDTFKLLECQPERVVCDLNDEYASSRYAMSLGLDFCSVQHHEAHVLAVAAEHSLTEPFLGIAWDGTGKGYDNTVWGGEFFSVTSDSVERVASFEQFTLIGGEKAIKEPFRVALVLLKEVLKEEEFSHESRRLFGLMPEGKQKLFLSVMRSGLGSPLTSSVGRLFDGVSALLGVCSQVTFEGQAAMNLEWCAMRGWGDERVSEFVPFKIITTKKGKVISWKDHVCSLVSGYGNIPTPILAAQFHAALVDCICTIATSSTATSVVLSGGCFQNKLLLEESVLALRSINIVPYWAERVPTNDGGIALGQLAYVARQQK